jgi:hypothetical protein
MSKIRKKDSIDDKTTNSIEANSTTAAAAAAAAAAANTTAANNNYQRVSERVQQWNRSVIISGFSHMFICRFVCICFWLVVDM